jgi:hypothetical protein
MWGHGDSDLPSGELSLTDYTNQLVALLQKKKIKIIGRSNFLGYNAPYQFFGRKNEISIPIEWEE